MSHIEQAEQQAELQKRLWAVANDLRGNMDASEYRNYILGLIFYRFLSEKVENYANELLQDDDVDFADAEQDADLMQDLKDEVIDVLGFFIEPRYLFTTMVKKINAGDFDVEMLQNAINEVQNSTLGKESESDFKGLFEDLDLQSSRLERV
ncbi:Type I restriction-modification system,methylation subunit [Lactiplantibacillus plantarum]|nr:Type I restriction-modification system,methylation subunit [Lactiplantibacillus plantarum]